MKNLFLCVLAGLSYLSILALAVMALPTIVAIFELVMQLIFCSGDATIYDTYNGQDIETNVYDQFIVCLIIDTIGLFFIFSYKKLKTTYDK